MSGERDVLAGKPADENVDGFYFAPADFGDITQVGHLGPVVCEYPAGGGVVFAVPYKA